MTVALLRPLSKMGSRLNLFLFLSVLGTFQIQTVVSKTNDDLVGIEVLSLNADSSQNIWTAYGVNSSGVEILVPATVPGGIYSDLENNGIFDSKIHWVGRTNWTYRRNFNVNSQLLEKTEVVLICEGLDTISKVFVNDQLVGTGDNMFTRYTFDVKDILQAGVNSIRVEFSSPVLYALQKDQEFWEEQGYPMVPRNVPDAYRGENHTMMIRKMQSQFAWDWGPAYANSGIWKNIYIQGFSGGVIRDVMIFSTTSKTPPDETSSTRWTVTARVYYDSALEGERATVEFFRVDGNSRTSNDFILAKGRGQSVDVVLTETGDETKLWWPNGYGNQVLYRYNVSLKSNGGDEITTRSLRFGFRTVELVEDFIDEENVEKGREFYFRVNGIQMYSKGSNSIPLHVLPERITSEQTEWLLRSAKLTHQNMIRVWGGGMYETEEFFDYCDEYGIMIWEDFMFAVAMYPATEEFLGSVRGEVETQVKRLQYRTSLALWAGNNENELAMSWCWWVCDEGRYPFYYKDYVDLYVNTIKAMLDEMDPSRDYIPSSPTNGKKTEEDGWVAHDPDAFSLIYGDIHYYNYGDDNWDWKMFQRTRYASEYGFQSFPHYETLEEVADDITTWTWEGAQNDHRQRHGNGNVEIREMIRNHLPFPVDHDSREAYPHMLYMSQLSQVMGQKTQTEFYRRLQDKLFDDGTGHNMGALYWQLNDIWEGASWASVEVNGRWKLMHYAVNKFLAPVLPSPFVEEGDLVVELVSDLKDGAEESKITVEVYKLGRDNAKEPVIREETSSTPEFLRSKEVVRIGRDRLDSAGCGMEADSGTGEPCLVYVNAEGYSDNFLFLQYPKNKDALRDPKLVIGNVSGSDDGHTINFTLEAEDVALFVFLTVKNDHRGYFNDNGFMHFANGGMQMTYYSEKGITPVEFQEQIKIVSLFDVASVA